MTNKNRKRGCPLNYLHYFVGEEVENCFRIVLLNFFYQSIPLFFLSIILLFFKGYIDSKNGIMDGSVTQFDLKVLKFFSETRKIEGKKCLLPKDLRGWRVGVVAVHLIWETVAGQVSVEELILPVVEVQLVKRDSGWQLDWIEARAILRLISLWNPTPPA